MLIFGYLEYRIIDVGLVINVIVGQQRDGIWVGIDLSSDCSIPIIVVTIIHSSCVLLPLLLERIWHTHTIQWVCQCKTFEAAFFRVLVDKAGVRMRQVMNSNTLTCCSIRMNATYYIELHDTHSSITCEQTRALRTDTSTHFIRWTTNIDCSGTISKRKKFNLLLSLSIDPNLVNGIKKKHIQSQAVCACRL